MTPLGPETDLDPRGAVDLLLGQLRSRSEGLDDREAARRLIVVGRNELVRRETRSWPKQLFRQFNHPLALLLCVAALLAAATGSTAVAIAIGVVIVLNAVFAFVQEQQAEQAVELLSRYLPPHATVVRGGRRLLVDATELASIGPPAKNTEAAMKLGILHAVAGGDRKSVV